MWLFTRYGFYSIACAEKPDGSVDIQMVMVRARCSAHLESLQERFKALADLEILTLPHRDYRYRFIVPKKVWSKIVVQLAEEQAWTNFKDETARFQGLDGTDYVDALHEVWSVMNRLQQR